MRMPLVQYVQNAERLYDELQESWWENACTGVPFFLQIQNAERLIDGLQESWWGMPVEECHGPHLQVHN